MNKYENLRYENQTASCAAAPPSHNITAIDVSLGAAVEALDCIYQRAKQAANDLLGAEPTPGQDATAQPTGLGRVGLLEDRLTRLHFLLNSLSYELGRIERAAS